MPATKQTKPGVITRRNIFLAVIGVLALVFVVGVVANMINSSSSLGLGISNDTSSAPGVAEEQYARDFDKSGAGENIKSDGSVADVEERKIIQTADLSLIVGSTEDAIDQISGIATQADGFVSSVDVFETSDNKKHGQITLRIPSSAFDQSVVLIKDLAVTVEREQINAQDVTEEFVDLEARLRNLEATEEQYVALLEQATDVEDVLAIQRELSNVRQDIERLEGRIQYLSRQTDMSTIRVSLVSEADVEIFGVTWSPVNEIKEGLRTLLSELVSFVNFLIALIFFLPVLLLWIVLIGVVAGSIWKVGVWIKPWVVNRWGSGSNK
ncbi:MAG: DUF4349 domain-containing protein [Candidatus Paceibacterota bacterium]